MGRGILLWLLGIPIPIIILILIFWHWRAGGARRATAEPVLHARQWSRGCRNYAPTGSGDRAL